METKFGLTAAVPLSPRFALAVHVKIRRRIQFINGLISCYVDKRE